MQEAERIINHHIYNVGAIRCIHDDSKSSCFLYLLSHYQFEYYHNHIMNCTEKCMYCYKHLWAVAWDFKQCGMCYQLSFRSACAYPQSDQSLCYSLEYSMSVTLLTEHHFEFLNFKGGCTGSSESTHVKMPHCWKSHVRAQLSISVSNEYRVYASVKLNCLCLKTI